jgi:TolA-binding protein
MTALEKNRVGDILAEADRYGRAGVLERADSDDLWAVANAARYAGRYLLAEQALSAHRRRFASSDRSREAAFLLGRLHEQDRYGPDESLGWYDRFLVEARGGAGVSDALGRRMTLLQRWKRHTEALAVAREYLRRFPGGTYAPAARALVESSIAKP